MRPGSLTAFRRACSGIPFCFNPIASPVISGSSRIACLTLCQQMLSMSSSANPKVTPKHTKLFINNKWVDAKSGKTFPNYNPATEEKICDVSEADAADIDEAVKSANAAFKRNSVWRKMDASARGKILTRAGELMEEQKSYIASLETLDAGKPYADSLGDVEHAADVFKYYAGLADKSLGKVLAPDGEYFAYTRPEPIGVCGGIIPWNYPISLFAWKVGPALACGNVCVIKPSELTPLTALHTAAIFSEAGLPAGVLTVLPGYGGTAGASLASHPGVRKVAFTGSTATARKIIALTANNLAKMTMELGGKSPAVIFPDANLDEAALYCHSAIMTNCGQNCCGISRNYVHADVYDEYVAKAVACAQNRIVGDPWKEDSASGSVISELQMNRILGYIESGKKEGAKLECGGERIGDKGWFIQPTVFSNVTDDMTIAKEEIFGPVQSILKFTDVEDVLDRCNASDYGLAAAVFTKDVDQSVYMAHNLKGGITWVNCADIMTTQTPFGGFKGSGYGKELGEDAMKEYCEMKTVLMKIKNKNS